MNRLDRIDQLRNAGIEASTILDEMTRWFSDDDIEKFYDDFVRVHEVTFGEEEEEDLCEKVPLGLAEALAAHLD